MSSIWSEHLGEWHILRLENHIRDEIEESIKEWCPGTKASADVGKGELCDSRCGLPIIRAFMEGELNKDLVMRVITLVPLSSHSVRFSNLQSYPRATSGSNQIPSSDSQQTYPTPLHMFNLYENNVD